MRFFNDELFEGRKKICSEICYLNDVEESDNWLAGGCNQLAKVS